MESTTVKAEQIGKRIRMKRKSMYFTINDVKERTAIAPGTLSEIERGLTIPSTTTLLKLSEIFECTTDWILKGTEPILYPFENACTNDRENHLIENYRLLTDTDKIEIEEIIHLKLRMKQ